MVDFPRDISQWPKPFQKPLRLADVSADNGLNDQIDTNEELDAAREVGKYLNKPFSGKTQSEAEAFLLAALLDYKNGVKNEIVVDATTKDSSYKPVEDLVKVTSGWRSTKEVQYSLNKNLLTVKGLSGNGNADSISLGKINTNGCSKLVVTVVSIKGNFSWGGKAFGLSINDKPLNASDIGNIGKFPEPDGKSISDDFFINGSLNEGEQLVYDIAGKDSINLGAKVFVANGVEIVLKFELVPDTTKQVIVEKKEEPVIQEVKKDTTDATADNVVVKKDEIISTSIPDSASKLKSFTEMLQDIGKTMPEVWDYYKNIKIEKATGRPLGDSDYTFSETVSYVMLRALQMKDRATFDKAWKWSFDNIYRPNLKKVYFANTGLEKWADPRTMDLTKNRMNNLSSWRWSGANSPLGQQFKLTGVVAFDWTETDKDKPWVDGFDAAPDGDVLISYCLLQADKLWKSGAGYQDYKGIAAKIIPDIWNNCVLNMTASDNSAFIKFEKMWSSNANANYTLFDGGNGVKIKYGNEESWGGIAGIHSLGLKNLDEFKLLTFSASAAKATTIKLIFQTEDGKTEYGIDVRLTPGKKEYKIPIKDIKHRVNYEFRGNSVTKSKILFHNFAIQGENNTEIMLESVKILKSEENQKQSDTKYFFSSANDKKSTVINVSYGMPFAFREFAKIDPSHDWLRLANDHYARLNECMNPALEYVDAKNPDNKYYNNGAMPLDWNTIDPLGKLICAYGTWDSFKTSDVQDTHICSWDGMRAYLWAAYDFLLNKDPEAESFLRKGRDFFAKELQNNNWIFNAYRVDGTPLEGARRGANDTGHPFGMGIALAVFCAMDDKESALKAYNLLKDKYNGGYFGSSPDDYFTANIITFAMNLFSTKYPAELNIK